LKLDLNLLPIISRDIQFSLSVIVLPISQKSPEKIFIHRTL